MTRPLVLIWIMLVLGEASAFVFGRLGIVIPVLSALGSLIAYVILDFSKRRGLFAHFYAFLAGRKYLEVWILLFHAALFLGYILFEVSSYQTSFELSLSKQPREGQILGYVEDIRETGAPGYRITLSKVSFKEKGEKGRELKGKVTAFTKESVIPGHWARIDGTIGPVDGPTNPGEFDGRTYAKANGIRYQFEGESVTSYRLVDGSLSEILSSWLREKAYGLRERLRAVYQEIMPAEDAAFLNAMVLGDKAGLTDQQRQLYEENGVMHLLAVSGLHMSIVGGNVYRFLRKRRHGYLVSCLTGGLILLFYAVMTGFGTSAVRAYLMFLVFLLSQYLGAEYDLASSMSLAGILMVMESPWRIAEGGWIISFLSIAGIAYTYPWLKKLVEKKRAKERAPGEVEEKLKISKLQEAFIFSISITLTTLPVTMRLFYEFSPLSILLNMVVIPLMTPLMTSAVAGGLAGLFFLWLAGILCYPARGVLAFYEGVFHLVRKIPGTLLITGRVSMWQMAVAYGLEALSLSLWYFGSVGETRFLWRRKKRRKCLFVLGTLTCLTLFMPMSWLAPGIAHLLYRVPLMGGIFRAKAPDQLTVCMLDVGQGDSLLLQFPGGGTMLIDGGSTSKKDVGSKVILPACKYYGINRLDLVMMTHADDDHISGIREIMQAGYPIGTFLMTGVIPDSDMADSDSAYLEMETLAKQDGARVRKILRGDRIAAGQVQLTCLHPFASYHSDDRNGYSGVLALQYGRFDMLFTGDLSEDGEEGIRQYYHKKGIHFLKDGLEVLKVAHHGSRYSSTESFLDFVNPQSAVISAGAHNRYGHPHRQTLKRLRKRTKHIYVTAENGAIIIQSNLREWSLNWYKHK